MHVLGSLRAALLYRTTTAGLCCKLLKNKYTFHQPLELAARGDVEQRNTL